MVEADIIEERIAARVAHGERVAQRDISLALEQTDPIGFCALINQRWDSEAHLDPHTVVELVKADVEFLGLRPLQQTLRAWQELSMNRDAEARSSLHEVGAALDKWPSRGNPSLFDGGAASSYAPLLATIQEFQRTIGRFHKNKNRMESRLAEEITELGQMAVQCRREAVLGTVVPMVFVPGGDFTMGTISGEIHEGPVHRVFLAAGFGAMHANNQALAS